MLRFAAALFCLVCVATVSRPPLLSLDVRNARFGDVIFMLATQSARNIIADMSSSDERVTLRVREASFDQILQQLARMRGLRVLQKDNVYLLTRTPVVRRLETQRRLPAVAITASPSLAPGSAGRAPDAAVSARSISLESINPSTAVDTLRELLPAATYIPDDARRTVTIVGSASALNGASRLFESADRREVHLVFDIRVIDVRLAEQQTNLAQELSDAPTTSSPNGTIYAFLKSTSALEGDLRFLIDVGRAQVLIGRRLVTVNRGAVNLSVGRQYPVLADLGTPHDARMHLMNVGADLEIKAALSAQGIATEIHARYELPAKAWRGPTILLTQRADYDLKVRGHQSVFVGGLFKDVDPDVIAAAPFLEDLPVVGPIFSSRRRHHTKDEICVVITPRIVGSQASGRAGPRERGARSP